MKALLPSEKRDVLITYLTKVFRHYKQPQFSHIKYWDIVNEAICDANPGRRDCDDSVGRAEDLGFLRARQDVSRPPLWYPDVPDYMDLAFNLARQELGDEAILVYNDYAIESISDPTDPNKAERAYEWIKAARARGVKVDAIGFQLHISTYHDGSGLSLFNNWVSGVREMAQMYADLGMEVHFTEIDIGCSFITTPCLPDLREVLPVDGFPDIFGTSSQEAKKAALYGKLLEICLEQPKCTAFQMWGATDRYTWRQDDPDNPSTFGSLLDHTPHIFDRDFKPKASAYTLAAILNAYNAARAISDAVSGASSAGP
jgi:endo-1,4-beta-xylanase